VFLLAPLRPAGLASWLGLSGVLDKTTGLLLAVFGIGLFLSSARHFIYYTLEGFYWTPFARWQYQWRDYTVRRAHSKYQTLEQKRSASGLSQRESLRQQHLVEFLNDFPVNTAGGTNFFVDRPTRIGNVIAAYELYAKDRYGIDGVFYWFHFRFLAPSYAQTELDRVEAIADGMVFATFSSCTIAGVYLIVLLGRLIGAFATNTWLHEWLLLLGAKDVVIWTFGVLSIICACIFNKLSIFALRSFGKNIRAVFDLGVPQVAKLGESWLPSSSQQERLVVRQDFLSYGIAPWRTDAVAGSAQRSPSTPRSRRPGRFLLWILKR
jgi:hypothetical protein